MKDQESLHCRFNPFGSPRYHVPVGLSAIWGPTVAAKQYCGCHPLAMGEQSAKILRGRQMEDVIFKRFEQSKPLGMAEVSILL